MASNTATFEVKSELVPAVPPKRFRSGGKLHYPVRIYIDGEPADLSQIENVQYELHPTFKDRYRVSDRRKTGFDIVVWTYGFFDVTARLHMHDGSLLTVTGAVHW
jgi:hypothetical protein